MHTEFTFTYSSHDWIKWNWKATANVHWEDTLVTDPEWHCAWPCCLFHSSFHDILHCIVYVGLFVSAKNWWLSSPARRIYMEVFSLLITDLKLKAYFSCTEWKCKGWIWGPTPSMWIHAGFFLLLRSPVIVYIYMTQTLREPVIHSHTHTCIMHSVTYFVHDR